MKYFEIDNKPCRSLPYDLWVLGSNRASFNKDHTIFVAYLNKDLKAYSKELEEYFEKFGPVKGAKAAIDSEYKLLGYGFVTFAEKGAVQNAINGTKEDPNFVVQSFQPKDRTVSKVKLVNNIYVKNFPPTWTEEYLKQLFSRFGHIKSIFLANYTPKVREGES